MSTRDITRRARLACATVGAVVVAGLSWFPAPAFAAVSYDLWAVSGSAAMPGGESVTVWGYQDSNVPATASGGPTLTATVGEEVSITLHNQVGAPTGLLVQGQAMVPDLAGIAGGTSRTYTFTAQRPGTFLYEAAPLPGAQYQPAMGLYGALVVSPAAAGQAYGGTDTAFDADQVLLLGELDPALNGAANPAGFDMRSFHPTYFTINGKAYPDTEPVVATPGTTELLRYVNAGLSHRSMTVLGADQTIVAIDGNPLRDPNRYVADTMGPGQTLDALVEVPALRSVDTELFVYDASNNLHNSNTGGVGGMLTSIPVAGVAAVGDEVGPVVSGATFQNGTLSAHFDDSGEHGGSDVDAVEYYLDDAVGSGTGTAMTATVAVSGDATADVTLPTGAPFEHVLYVRAHDAADNWGPLTSVLVTANDTGGPAVVSPLLKPNLANGANTAAVKISATADDTGSGNSTIDAAEYFIDSTGATGSGTAMSVSPAGAGIASIDATIPVGVLDALEEGNHTVYIRAKDAEGVDANWGEFVTVNLTIDETGPSTNGVTVSPSPNNGNQPYNSSVPGVRVIATTMTDPLSGAGAFGQVNSQIAAAEMFIDSDTRPNGTGVRLIPQNGTFVDTTEGGYADIPLATVRQLAEGTHIIYVHAKDAAGNWGAFGQAELVIDKTGPTVQALSATVAGASVAQPQAVGSGPTNGAAQVTLDGTATDDVSSVTAAQWWWDSNTANRSPVTLTEAGDGSFELSATVPVSGLGDGNHRLRVRVRDGAGNWSSVATNVHVTWPLDFSTLGDATPRGLLGTGDNSDGYLWSGSAYTRAVDLTAGPYGVPEPANVDGLSKVDAAHFYLSFSGNTRLPGLGRVQDEDVVFWNDGGWELFFDGTSHGLRSKKADVDAVSVVGDTLFFSTQGNVKPRRVKGRADDADIYRWNGSRFSRVWDASRHRIPSGANVDGYDRVDKQHFYVSFAATHRIAKLGRVQDEDVVAWSAGSLTVYFDGTAHGMAGSRHDVDGLDVP